MKAVARLGGFLPYQKAPPGVKRLWQGWRFLQAMVAGYQVAKTGKPILGHL